MSHFLVVLRLFWHSGWLYGFIQMLVQYLWCFSSVFAILLTSSQQPLACFLISSFLMWAGYFIVPFTLGMCVVHCLNDLGSNLLAFNILKLWSITKCDVTCVHLALIFLMMFLLDFNRCYFSFIELIKMNLFSTLEEIFYYWYFSLKLVEEITSWDVCSQSFLCKFCLQLCFL